MHLKFFIKSELFRFFNFLMYSQLFIFQQVNRVLRTIFKSENWTLDESSLITSNEEYFTTPGLFPFEKAFEWVRAKQLYVI